MRCTILNHSSVHELLITYVAWAVDPLCGMLCHLEARIWTQYGCALLNTGTIHTRVNSTLARVKVPVLSLPVAGTSPCEAQWVTWYG